MTLPQTRQGSELVRYGFGERVEQGRNASQGSMRFFGNDGAAVTSMACIPLHQGSFTVQQQPMAGYVGVEKKD